MQAQFAVWPVPAVEEQVQIGPETANLEPRPLDHMAAATGAAGMLQTPASDQGPAVGEATARGFQDAQTRVIPNRTFSTKSCIENLQKMPVRRALRHLPNLEFIIAQEGRART